MKFENWVGLFKIAIGPQRLLLAIEVQYQLLDALDLALQLTLVWGVGGSIQKLPCGARGLYKTMMEYPTNPLVLSVTELTITACTST